MLSARRAIIFVTCPLRNHLASNSASARSRLVSLSYYSACVLALCDSYKSLTNKNNWNSDVCVKSECNQSRLPRLGSYKNEHNGLAYGCDVRVSVCFLAADDRKLSTLTFRKYWECAPLAASSFHPPARQLCLSTHRTRLACTSERNWHSRPSSA